MNKLIDYLDSLPSSVQFLLVGLVVSLFVMVVTL